MIKPEDIKTVPDKGLPFHKTSYKFGNLFILFKIKFPDTIEEAKVGDIATALSTMKGADVDMNNVAETIQLKPYNEHQRNTHAQGGTQGDASDEDEDDGHG